MFSWIKCLCNEDRIFVYVEHLNSHCREKSSFNLSSSNSRSPGYACHLRAGRCIVFALELGMGVRDIFRSRQLSSLLFFQKSCQCNCQVNCATTNFLQGNFKSILFQKTLSRQLSSQLWYQKTLQGNCQVNYLVKIHFIVMSIIVILRSILVNYGKFWSIMVNYGQLWSILGHFT